MDGPIDEIDHMRSRLNGQRMVREAGPWRDVRRHFTREFHLPVGAFRQQHDHQVLERNESNP